MILFYDVETTGKADFNRPHTDPTQPRVVQLAALLFDGERQLAALNFIIQPDGFLIPEEAANIHGITYERAMDEGVNIDFALGAFVNLAALAELQVGHNIDFDRFVMRGELHRARRWDALAELPTYCTMLAATPICKLPARTTRYRGDDGYKWPRLSEAYEFAFGQPLLDAHNAMADLSATVALYRWLIDLPEARGVSGQYAAPPQSPAHATQPGDPAARQVGPSEFSPSAQFDHSRSKS